MTTRSILSGVAVGGLSTLALSLGGFDRAQAATILLSENFGSGAPFTEEITGSLNSSFNVTAGNVDIIGQGTGIDIYPSPPNGNYLDLNGTTSGTIASVNSFTFLPGESATLTFDFGRNTELVTVPTSAQVFLGSTLLATLNDPVGSSFTAFSQTISNPTNGTLRFASTNSGVRGIVLDNIVLTSNPAATTAVPEPSDLVGTAFAFGSVVLLKRKLSKKTVKLDRFSK
ncbi:PEP-CTERM sorting domain-containing protein [Chamaesiphon polymorphus]|nr:PEP-CTERM sorting domain-containing protein [Chamaesiphon polymorphus]